MIVPGVFFTEGPVELVSLSKDVALVLEPGIGFLGYGLLGLHFYPARLVLLDSSVRNALGAVPFNFFEASTGLQGRFCCLGVCEFVVH